MDPEIETWHRARAERHVAEGQARLAGQAILVAGLAPGSRVRPLATELLATMQETLRL